MSRTKEEKPEKRPGYRSSIKSVWFGAVAVLTVPIPVAGLVLGCIAMNWGKRGKQESEKYQQELANLGRALGALGVFLNVLMITAVISVWFLNKTDIINLGAP